MFEAILNYAKEIWRWIKTQKIEEGLKCIVDKVNTLQESQNLQSEILLVHGSLLRQILAALPPQRAVAFLAYLTDEQGNRIRQLHEGETMNQKVTDLGLNIELVAIDKFGNVGAALDGPLVWANDAAFTVVDTSADPSGLKAKVTYVGPIGDTMITAKGDGDLGPGVTEIGYQLDLHLMPGSAVSFQANVTPVQP